MELLLYILLVSSQDSSTLLVSSVPNKTITITTGITMILIASITIDIMIKIMNSLIYYDHYSSSIIYLYSLSITYKSTIILYSSNCLSDSSADSPLVSLDPYLISL